MEKLFEVREFKIPMPWGHVAVKAWGKESNPLILVFHGRMDNAGAFDHLIPLLPDNFQYICIDLPSHGKSSHFPPHLPIYTLNYLIVYKLIMKYFQRETYTIIGHSYGGHIGKLYARLYPESVEKLVMIDTVYFDVVPVEYYKDYMKRKIAAHLNLLEKFKTGKQPQYNFEEAFKRIKFSRETGDLTDKGARALLKRNLEPVGDEKYKFTLDQRMKDYLDQTHDMRYAVESLIHDPIKCPLLMILADNTRNYTDTFQPMLDVLKKLPNVDIQRVRGGHDIHNDEPEKIAPMISKFLLSKELKYFESSAQAIRSSSRILNWLRAKI